jgi:hypothetical protein
MRKKTREQFFDFVIKMGRGIIKGAGGVNNKNLTPF